MEHWFDGLAKKLAAADGSRRTFLGGIFATLGAAATSTVPGAAGLAEMFPGEADTALRQNRTDRRGSCTLESTGNDTTVHHSVQSTFNGKVLAHATQLTLTRPDRKALAFHITSTGTITLGGDALVKIDRDSREGSTQIKVTYGSAFQGVREVTYTSDGKTIEGTIDGQRIAPLSVTADPRSLRLADGRTPPPVKADPALATALDQILKKAKDDIETCAGESGRAAIENQPSGLLSGFATRLTGFFALEVVHADGDSTTGAYMPDPQGTIPQNSSQCQKCQDSCATAAAICDAAAYGASAACLFGYAFCVAAAQAVCTATGIVCVNNCNSAGTNENPGGSCCPVGCPNANNPTGCCYQNQQCSGTANVCCASNVVVCNGNCCPPGYVCKEGVCCTPDRPVCHGVCCPTGSVCSNEGICCRQFELNVKPVSCGGTCCAKGQKCAKGYAGSTSDLCCPDNQVCADGVCCPHGCVDGKCRPLCLVGVPCGASCCDWGCDNASTSTCKKAQTCARGQSVCTANQAGVANVCCPTGTGCLDGKCCPTGTVACNNKSTGKMGCFPKAQCAAPPPPPK